MTQKSKIKLISSLITLIRSLMRQYQSTTSLTKSKPCGIVSTKQRMEVLTIHSQTSLAKQYVMGARSSQASRPCLITKIGRLPLTRKSKSIWKRHQSTIRILSTIILLAGISFILSAWDLTIKHSTREIWRYFKRQMVLSRNSMLSKTSKLKATSSTLTHKTF